MTYTPCDFCGRACAGAFCSDRCADLERVWQKHMDEQAALEDEARTLQGALLTVDSNPDFYIP